MSDDTDPQQQSNPANTTPIVDPELAKELNKVIEDIEFKSLEDHTKAEAVKHQLPYLNLKGYPIETKALYLVPQDEARQARAAIIDKNSKELIVAVHGPYEQATKILIAKLKKQGYSPKMVMVSDISLREAWKRYDQLKPRTTQDLGTVTVGTEQVDSVIKRITKLKDLKEDILKYPITEIVDIIVAGALQLQASDIHIEPSTDAVRIRYRLDGVLTDILTFPTTEYKKLLSRIKLHSHMKINIDDRPQDGRFHVQKDTHDIEVRVSALPGPDGESIVMRILDPRTIRKKLKDLGMRDAMLAQLQELLTHKAGAILTTGPTGSGKTTTLYAFVEHINSPEIKVVTIEDPIEYRIPGIIQTQTNQESGYTFAAGLKSIVRQDPDVILVGEIRDLETAEMAAQAALTGHLVFSTVHTNNAAGTIPRLIDLGLKPVTIAPAINAAMAQRLVRRLCMQCRALEKIHDADFAFMQKHLDVLPPHVDHPEFTQAIELYYAKGCQACNNTGYQGRIGVYELFVVGDEMERLIMQNPTVASIEKLAMKHGMVTMLQDGIIKVLQGVTSLEEIRRVVD